METYAIILAAGSGTRMKGDKPKQFMKLSGKSIIEHTVSIFNSHANIDKIIIVTVPEYRTYLEELLLPKYSKIYKILNGGSTRQESSYIGLKAIPNSMAKVLIHDAVRPFVSYKIIDDVLSALDRYDAVDVAIPSSDTIIKVQENDKNNIFIEYIPNRKYLWRGQTPQGFRLQIIKKAHEMALKDNYFEVTDDCGLVLRYNLAKIYVVKGSEENIKITYPIDLYIADRIFQLRAVATKNFNQVTSFERLKGKVMVIFGSSRGIGYSIMQLASSYGAVIYGYSRTNGVDVSNYDNIVRVLKDIQKNEGKIDFIVNTAAILRMGDIEYRSIQEIQEEIFVNYIGSINVVKAAIPFLKNTQGSIILFTSSSYTRGRPFYSIYSSSKAAIVNFVQAVSEEIKRYGIKINVINPERTATPMRFENFGKEDPSTLLDPYQVAKASLAVLLSNLTGCVIDVRKNEDK